MDGHLKHRRDSWIAAHQARPDARAIRAVLPQRAQDALRPGWWLDHLEGFRTPFGPVVVSQVYKGRPLNDDQIAELHELCAKLGLDVVISYENYWRDPDETILVEFRRAPRLNVGSVC